MMLTVLALTACGGGSASLVVEGATELEDIRSVVWSTPQRTHAWFLGGGHLDDAGETTLEGAITFHDVAGACEDRAATLDAWEAASVDLLGASADGTDTAALCEAVPAFLDAMAAVDAEQENGVQRLGLGYCVGDDCGDPIDATTYAIGDGSSAQWSAVLTYTDAAHADGWNERAAAAWNVDTCGFDAEFVEGELDAVEAWVAVDGDVVVTDASRERISAELDLLLADDHGNNATVTGDFSAEICTLPDVSDLVLLL